MKKKQQGFTLIELLVAITIIIILGTLGFVSYGYASANARNAKRKSDIEQIRSALEMYRADTGYYPDWPSSFISVGVNETSTPALSSYLPTVPPDPKDNTNYPYQIKMTDSRGTPAHYYGYCLAAYTESEGSGSNACTAETLPTTSKTYNYGVKNP